MNRREAKENWMFNTGNTRTAIHSLIWSQVNCVAGFNVLQSAIIVFISVWPHTTRMPFKGTLVESIVTDICSTIPMHESNVSSSWANAHLLAQYIGCHIYFIGKLNRKTRKYSMCVHSFLRRFVTLAHMCTHFFLLKGFYCLTTSVDNHIVFWKKEQKCRLGWVLFI